MAPDNTQAPDSTQNPTPNPSAAILAMPQPGQPGASASAALGAATAPPSPTAAPQPITGTPASQSPTPTPQQQVAVAQTARHAALGRLASYLLGHENQYNVNPQTGQVDTTQVQRKPGDLFRSIVTGAVMGMAAGAGTHDFAGGFGKGGAAAMQNQQAQDQQKYQRAQQQAENFQKQQQFNEEKKLHDAQVAQMNANGVRADWEMGVQSAKYIDEHNDRERAFQFQLDQMGATPMQIQVGGQDVNGQVGNGQALQKLVGENLDAVKPPDGYHTIHTMEVNTAGLSVKDGQWVDEDGQPVGIHDRIAHTLYQVPDNIWNEHAEGVDTSDEVNKIAGFQLLPPGKKVSMTNGQLMSVRAKGQENALQESEINLNNARAGAARGKTVPASKDAQVNASVNDLLSKNASDADMETTLGSSKLSSAQKNEVRKMYKQLLPKPAGSAVDRAIAQLSGGKAGTPDRTPPPPPAKAILYDPQGNAHTVDENLLNQYLASPQYKGWHK
jgi:hypothetical protein